MRSTVYVGVLHCTGQYVGWPCLSVWDSIFPGLLFCHPHFHSFIFSSFCAILSTDGIVFRYLNPLCGSCNSMFDPAKALFIHFAGLSICTQFDQVQQKRNREHIVLYHQTSQDTLMWFGQYELPYIDPDCWTSLFALFVNPDDDDFVVNDDTHDKMATPRMGGDDLSLLEAPVIPAIPFVTGHMPSCPPPV